MGKDKKGILAITIRYHSYNVKVLNSRLMTRYKIKFTSSNLMEM